MINNKKNKGQDNQRSNYLMEFDKNLDIRNVREKSQEKRHSLNDSESKQFFRANLIPDEDNNQNNETYKRKYVNMNNNNFAPLNDSISFINKLQNISAEINLKNNNDNVKIKPLTHKSTYINSIL